MHSSKLNDLKMCFGFSLLLVPKASKASEGDFLFLASQDAIEVMRVTHWLTYLLDVSIDFTDVTLVSDDNYRRLYWCDPEHSEDPDESYLMMKVI